MNKIYLGNAYNLIKKIPDKSIDCIYTDVPYLYNTGGGGNSSLSKQIIQYNNELINDNLTNGFDYSILDEFVRVLKKINILIWLSKLQIQEVLNYFMSLEREIFFEILVWKKTNPIPATNNVWLSDLEYALYFREKGVKLNDGYDFKHKGYVSPINQKDKKLFNHPTIKPLEFVKNNLLHITQENDVVLDAFIGSGTTAVACKEIGRNYIGFEYNPKYYQIAIDRINGLSQVDVRKKEKGILNIFDFISET